MPVHVTDVSVHWPIQVVISLISWVVSLYILIPERSAFSSYAHLISDFTCYFQWGEDFPPCFPLAFPFRRVLSCLVFHTSPFSHHAVQISTSLPLSFITSIRCNWKKLYICYKTKFPAFLQFKHKKNRIMRSLMNHSDWFSHMFWENDRKPSMRFFLHLTAWGNERCVCVCSCEGLPTRTPHPLTALSPTTLLPTRVRASSKSSLLFISEICTELLLQELKSTALRQKVKKIYWKSNRKKRDKPGKLTASRTGVCTPIGSVSLRRRRDRRHTHLHRDGPSQVKTRMLGNIVSYLASPTAGCKAWIFFGGGGWKNDQNLISIQNGMKHPEMAKKERWKKLEINFGQKNLKFCFIQKQKLLTIAQAAQKSYLHGGGCPRMDTQTDRKTDTHTHTHCCVRSFVAAFYGDKGRLKQEIVRNIHVIPSHGEGGVRLLWAILTLHGSARQGVHLNTAERKMCVCVCACARIYVCLCATSGDNPDESFFRVGRNLPRRNLPPLLSLSWFIASLWKCW